MSQFQLDEEAIFDLARKIESHEARADYLDQACGTDKVLKDRVAELLQAHDKEQSFLEHPPVELDQTIDVPRITEKPGDTIGPYKLLEQIGEGGMGSVYMATQTEPIRRKVALKVIKPGMDTKQVIARFEAERQAFYGFASRVEFSQEFRTHGLVGIGILLGTHETAGNTR